MYNAQFIFVTENARIVAVCADGRLEDVIEPRDLLPARADAQDTESLAQAKKRLLKKFAD